jgi:PAS domain-containing protein
MDASSVNLILNALTVILGGTALGVVLRYKAKIKELEVGQHGSDREDDRADFEAIIRELAGQRDRANQRADDCDKRIDQLEGEIQGLRLARDLDPFPNWVVDTQGIYQFVNRAFEEHFLEPKGLGYRDAIGKRHEDLWPGDFLRTIKALDTAARRRPDGTARARASLDVPSLGLCDVTVHKFPIRFKPSNAIVAFAGYITEMEPDAGVVG